MKHKSSRGFTIVELLVVIVVIGILAAITIVSYAGITARANTAKALSNAQSLQTVLEVYNTDNGSYPGTIAAITGYNGTTKLPAGITVVGGSTGTAGAFTTPAVGTLWGTNITSANFGKTVTWACSPNCTTPTGGRITYYDFTGGGGQSSTVLYVGAATSASDFVAAS